MSEEQLKAFLEKVKGDTTLQEKLKAAASPEAAIEIAKEAGFAITAKDIKSTKSWTCNYLGLPIQSAMVEVSDKELESAAGGQRTQGWCSIVGCPDRTARETNHVRCR